MMNREQIEDFGFQWPEETELECIDGEKIRVIPTTYMSSRENQGSGERFRKALRLYDITHADGRKESLVSELEIEKRLRIDWTAKRIAWIQTVGDLVEQIKGWATTRRWMIAEEMKDVSEDYIGNYRVTSLFIETPYGRVHVDPVGVNIIGAEGRVDIMAFPSLSRILLVRIGKEWRLKTESRVDWPKPWGEETFVELVKALTDQP